MTSRNIFRIGLFLLLVIYAGSAWADVCVWRDPDRTMNKLFPEAQDYLTITKKMSPSVIEEIEKSLGSKLDESEKKEFNFYDLRTLKDGKAVSVGIAMALAGKGEYGTIEIVIGVDLSSKIRAVYIQRSRERNNKVLKSKVFLDQFIGKSAEDSLEFGKDLHGLDEAPVAAEAARITIKKMLLFQKQLKNTKEERS